MATYIERTREVVSNEDDDFFKDDTVLYYVNKSLHKVVSYLIKTEQTIGRSLRALDDLRQYKDISVNGITFTDDGNYFSAEVPFPTTAGEEINQFALLKYDGTGVMRELTQNNIIQLEWGNLSPSDYESYYLINKNSLDNIVFEIYTSSDDSATSKNLRVYYILKPTEIQSADESLTELPDQLENAIVYGAALMMVMQESVKDPNTQAELFSRLYKDELQSNTY